MSKSLASSHTSHANPVPVGQGPQLACELQPLLGRVLGVLPPVLVRLLALEAKAAKEVSTSWRAPGPAW
jgi:hypothetical protein